MPELSVSELEVEYTEVLPEREALGSIGVAIANAGSFNLAANDVLSGNAIGSTVGNLNSV